MDLNRIAVFARVVEAGSFTAAAEALGVRTSSVSRSVAALEAELGIRLLQRTSRRIALTEAGRAYHEGTRDALAAIEEAQHAAASLGAVPRGLVRLTAPSGFAGGLAPVTAAFVRAHPDVRVEVVLTTRFVDLVKEGFDLAVRGGPLGDSSLLARKLGDTEHALFASRAYLGAAGRPRRLAELGHHECVLYRTAAGTAVWQVDGPAGPEEVTVHGRIAADDYEFVSAVVQSGLGIGLGPEPVFAPAVEAGILERVLPRYAKRTAPVHVVWPSRRFEPAAVTMLRDALAAELPRWMGRHRAVAVAR